MATAVKRARTDLVSRSVVVDDNDNLVAHTGNPVCGDSKAAETVRQRCSVNHHPSDAGESTDQEDVTAATTVVAVPVEGDHPSSHRLSAQSFTMPRFTLATKGNDLPVHRRRPLSPRQQRKIVRFDPPWPVCRYHDSSKRVSRLRRSDNDDNDDDEPNGDGHGASSSVATLSLFSSSSSSTFASSSSLPLSESDRAMETHNGSRGFVFLASRASRRYETVDDALAELNGWSACPEIAIDGTNGCGKSTLARSMNRVYLKINELLPRVTDGYGYNLSVFQSLEYLMFQQSVRATDVVWDRCRYSNLAFYYAHLLMHRYRDVGGVPNDRAVVFEALNSFASATNLAYTLATMEREKPVPVLFLVCRDLEMVALALQRRGTATDLSNAKERDYQLAQYFAYCYFASLLSYPVFDLSDLISERFTLGDLQQAIRDRVDVRHRPVDRDRCLSRVPNTESADRLAAFLARVDDVLLYDRSLK